MDAFSPTVAPVAITWPRILPDEARTLAALAEDTEGPVIHIRKPEAPPAEMRRLLEELRASGTDMRRFTLHYDAAYTCAKPTPRSSRPESCGAASPATTGQKRCDAQNDSTTCFSVRSSTRSRRKATAAGSTSAKPPHACGDMPERSSRWEAYRPRT